MDDFYRLQLDALNKYFKHLKQFGYMNEIKTLQILAAVLLIDSIDYFKDFIDTEFAQSVDRILRKWDCCNCAINWTDYEAATTQPYFVNPTITAATKTDVNNNDLQVVGAIVNDNDFAVEGVVSGNSLFVGKTDGTVSDTDLVLINGSTATNNNLKLKAKIEGNNLIIV